MHVNEERRQAATSRRLADALPETITVLRLGAGFPYRGLIRAEIIAAVSGPGFPVIAWSRGSRSTTGACRSESCCAPKVAAPTGVGRAPDTVARSLSSR